jgi:ABC-type enterobactin transport system permease subunit
MIKIKIHIAQNKALCPAGPITFAQAIPQTARRVQRAHQVPLTTQTPLRKIGAVDAWGRFGELFGCAADSVTLYLDQTAKPAAPI